MNPCRRAFGSCRDGAVTSSLTPSVGTDIGVGVLAAQHLGTGRRARARCPSLQDVLLEEAGSIVTIQIDDGKVNAFTEELLSSLSEALEFAVARDRVAG